MKRAGGLWPEIVSFDNLVAAARRAALGKRDRVEVATFLRELEPEVFALQRALEDGSYQPGPYRAFEVREPKPRLIHAAPFRDRVVHHALCHVIEPVFERRFIAASYACRAGKGTHRALRHFVRLCHQHRYVLLCDIEAFFPSIDHEVLLAQVARAIKDRRVLALVARIVSSAPSSAGRPPSSCAGPGFAGSYLPGDTLFTPLERRRGLPIGNLTSQLLANVVLDPLDHQVKETLRVPGYLRYCDDFALFADNKAELRAQRAALQGVVEGLRLRLHPTKSRVRRTGEGLRFLGFRLTTSGQLRIDRQRLRAFERRLIELRAAYRRGELDLAAVGQRVRSFCAHAAQGDCRRVLDHVLATVVF